MAYTNRFGLLILFAAVGCAALYWVLAWILNANAKRTAGRIEVEHEYEDKAADIEIGGLKQVASIKLTKLQRDKQAELDAVRKKMLGKVKK